VLTREKKEQGDNANRNLGGTGCIDSPLESRELKATGYDAKHKKIEPAAPQVKDKKKVGIAASHKGEK